ncbi:MAG TPA: S41 family peptidase, partial [Roseiarcus sp.]|nr:S41 family peptidase [Roseiarcus sp.]
MPRGISYLAFGVAFGAAIASYAAGGAPPSPASGGDRLALFSRVFDKVNESYVDKPDDDKMVVAAINGMLASLDPHSTYLDSKALNDFQVTMKGEEFGGLGLEVMQEGGLVRVVSPIDDTPAARAGMMSGDIITAIDDTPVQGLTLKEAVDKMRGPAKTSVRLKVSRGANKDAREFTIVREIIKVLPVRSRIESGDIGYIRITQFNQQTFDGVQKAIAKFRDDPGSDKLKGYILDLRNNPGGLLTQSIEVVNAFVDHGEIVSTRGRTADQAQEYMARAGADLSQGKPLVVLINGGSASASEIVSGALQDLKRATLIGTRSFGKGSVQTVLSLGENGALKLTTARYYTPSGRSIQAKGIEPDIKVRENIPDDLKGKVDSKGEASLVGHLKNGDDEKTGSEAYVPPDPANDTQLIAAVELLHGRS